MGAIYTCPTCGEKMARDLVLFTRHTDAHIVEALKKTHPEWITDEGFCPKCLDHFKAALRGERVVANIGGRQVTRRWAVMGVSPALTAGPFAALILTGAPRLLKLALFFPLFGAWIGFLQARTGTCVALGFKGTKNMDGEEEPVKDPGEKKRLRGRSARILLAASALAAGSALFLYVLPS